MSEDEIEEPPPEDESEESLADDLLDGADAYAKFLGWPKRRIFYYLEIGELPGGKIGNKWIGSKRVVSRRIRELTSARNGV